MLYTERFFKRFEGRCKPALKLYLELCWNAVKLNWEYFPYEPWEKTLSSKKVGLENRAANSILHKLKKPRNCVAFISYPESESNRHSAREHDFESCASTSSAI